MNLIPPYPASSSITLEHRPFVHDLLRTLPDGISEFSFANLYLFRHNHNYRLTTLADGSFAILGKDKNAPFFMIPQSLPDQSILALLFLEHTTMKCVSKKQKKSLEALGYRTIEDRDNFDYLYRREDLSDLRGRRYHKKRNLIKAFVKAHEFTAEPLLDEHIPAAIEILDTWRRGQSEDGDYTAAREGLEKSWELQLCGGIYFVGNKPVGYSLGEEIADGSSFVIHFEKGVPGYKGLFQFINQSFAAILPEFYQTINREQDLGDPGLRQAKHSYKPTGYVYKYRAFD
ncbi:DUF2156 domain-containing protein [Desulfopila sp. IMCC35008]|uniref:DUF2156 domain-containing protein n=1 Tax=Desulfopila sp. IMCC35008 TaxID=2653858 RepID=UPI0013D8AFC7|nr:phosphatidylglycerol lysyltransferase domain-containing protein [Desulfopila sp. IMCC35008]